MSYLERWEYLRDFVKKIERDTCEKGSFFDARSWHTAKLILTEMRSLDNKANQQSLTEAGY
jgi:hypothetical protein